MESLEEKLKNIREHLLYPGFPLGVDELLGEIEYLFEDDEEVSQAIDKYIDGYEELWLYAEKYCKIRDMVKEDLENEETNNAAN